MNIAELFPAIRRWARDRDIIHGVTPYAQIVKLMEESGELAKGVIAHDLDEIKDGIGDCVVVLTVLAAQYDLTLEECLSSAYDVIKFRKGSKIDGFFVKEGD